MNRARAIVFANLLILFIIWVGILAFSHYSNAGYRLSDYGLTFYMLLVGGAQSLLNLALGLLTRKDEPYLSRGFYFSALYILIATGVLIVAGRQIFD